MKQGDNLKPIMEKTEKIRKTKTDTRVEGWIMRFGKDQKYDGIKAKQLPNGKWMCEIVLPYTGICVKAVGKTESKAISNAATKAKAVIDEFMHCNMNTSATIKSIQSMGIEIGENSEFTSTQLAKKQKERMINTIRWAKRNEINE